MINSISKNGIHLCFLHKGTETSDRGRAESEFAGKQEKEQKMSAEVTQWGQRTAASERTTSGNGSCLAFAVTPHSCGTLE